MPTHHVLKWHAKIMNAVAYLVTCHWLQPFGPKCKIKERIASSKIGKLYTTLIIKTHWLNDQLLLGWLVSYLDGWLVICLFEAGRLLTFPTFKVGAYSRLGA